ncbi:hypothetical protein LK996_08060 [Lysobacter sp. A6]|uniref:Uncharacterized protein n=1 Tax=Noviluteimonas lactosilytica TaxID=2888523 RepID=A0ABS8JHS6_9GAMM|nr:hypothetical protein [Lysobacter lactosilyticus]MCC8363028.1 hypothetical protein [Lysobacter lactosilyticus]
MPNPSRPASRLAPALAAPPLVAAVLVAALLAACARPPPPKPGAERPVDAVRVVVDRLRDNDPAGFAIVAIPASLHDRLETAWRTGRSQWPLDELPLEDRLPAMLAALAQPDARKSLQATFDRQFANSSRELRSAATSLGVFGVQYIRNEGVYSDAEREHYAQAVSAVSRWAAQAPLSDPRRARGAIALLATAASHTRIDAPEDFANLGMDESLQRLGPFFSAVKQTFASYGLDLDATFDGLEATLVQQAGDDARVRVRYRLGSEWVDAVLDVRRVDGRWYLDDYLRNAEASLEGPVPRVPTLPAGATSVLGPASP